METDTQNQPLEKRIKICVGKHIVRKDGECGDTRLPNLLETRYVLYTTYHTNNGNTSITRDELTMDKLIGCLDGIFDVADNLIADIKYEFKNNCSDVGYSIGTYQKRTENGRSYFERVSWLPDALDKQELRDLWGKVPGIRKLLEYPMEREGVRGKNGSS